MAKFKFKLKKNWKKVLTVGLGILMFIGAIFGISAIAKKAEENTKTVSPTFTVGGLANNGKYIETTDSIYTKDAFECQGLRITPEFDSKVSYQVFFYDANGEFLRSSPICVDYYETTPLLAVYARVVIYPIDDDKISWYEIGSYANDLKINVFKSQKKENLTSNLFVYHGLAMFDHTNATFTEASPGAVASEFIDIENYSTVKVVLPKSFLTDENVRFYVYDIEDAVTMSSLVLADYEHVSDEDTVIVTINNLSSFEKVMLAHFSYNDDNLVELFQTVRVYGLK